MPGARLPMRKIRDVLRLSAAGLSKRKIAASLGISATAAGDCLRRAGRAGVVWPLPEGITDEILEARLYPAATAIAAMSARRPRPDWAAIHRELRRPGVTLQLLWEEHRATCPDGYGYSRYVAAASMWRHCGHKPGKAGFAGSARNIFLGGAATTELSGTSSATVAFAASAWFADRRYRPERALSPSCPYRPQHRRVSCPETRDRARRGGC
jgi:hypothetical protein